MLRIVCFKTHPAITDAWTRAAAKFDLSWTKVDYVDLFSFVEKQSFIDSLRDSIYDHTLIVSDYQIFVDQLPNSICDKFNNDTTTLFIGPIINHRTNVWFGQILNPQCRGRTIFKTSTLFRILNDDCRTDDFSFIDDDKIIQLNREFPYCVNVLRCITCMKSNETRSELDEKFKTKQIRIDSMLYNYIDRNNFEEFEWEFKK